MQATVDIRGFTLIELMIVIVIAAILLVLAIPAFTGMIDRNRLKAATENVQADFLFARTEAIKRNTPIRVNFTTSDGGATWCYGLKDEGADCDCIDDTPLCEIGDIKKVAMGSSTYPGTKATPTGTGKFTFDNVRGTVNAGSVRLDSAQTKQTKVVVSSMGRIRSCSPAGSANVAGYSICP